MLSYVRIYIYIYRHISVTVLSCLRVKLTPRSRVLLEKLTGSQLVKKFPAFYETTFTRARYLSLFGARSIQSMPPSHVLKIHFNIILPFTPGSSTRSLFQVSPPKPCTCLSPIRATFSTHLVLSLPTICK